MMHTFTNTEFTRSMKKSHTIYMPEMLHYHNELLCAAFAFGGYKLAVVPEQEHICYETQSLVNKELLYLRHWDHWKSSYLCEE